MQLLSNPMLAKELRGRIRGNRALIILTVYLVITGAIAMLVYAVAAPSDALVSNAEAGRDIGRAIFLTVMTAALVQVCIITPSLTAGAIAGEKERQTYDLLITTLLSPLQIILGKLSAAIAFALLLILSTLPLAGLAFLFGGVSGTEMLIGIVGLTATAIFYACIGLFWSSVMRSTLGATVTAQGFVILKLLGVPFLFFIISALIDGFSGSPSALFIYVMGTFLCVHPFIALGITQGSLINGDSPFYLMIPVENGEILVPSPWLVYLFIAVVGSLVFLFLSVKLLRPVDYRPPRRKAAG